VKISFENKGTSFSFPLPLCAIYLIPSNIVNNLLKHYSNFQSNDFAKNFDFKDIKKSLKVLKSFKNINILELKLRHGDIITIST